MSNIVKVDGWVVEEHEGAWSIRDVELAEKVGLSKPRDIRSTIAKALADGALIIGAAATGANDEPVIWLEAVEVVSGKGRVETVNAYRLSRPAALVICGKLRTKIATAITIAIVKVFEAVLSGRATLAPAIPEPPPPPKSQVQPVLMGADHKAELLMEAARTMSADVPVLAKDVMRAHAVALLTGSEVTRFLPALPAGIWRRPAEIAGQLGCSLQRVGLAITALDLRGDATHCRSHLDKKAHGAPGEVTVYSYDEWAFEQIRAHIAGGPAAVPSGTGGE